MTRAEVTHGDPAPANAQLTFRSAQNALIQIAYYKGTSNARRDDHGLQSTDGIIQPTALVFAKAALIISILGPTEACAVVEDIRGFAAQQTIELKEVLDEA